MLLAAIGCVTPSPPDPPPQGVDGGPADDASADGAASVALELGAAESAVGGATGDERWGASALVARAAEPVIDGSRGGAADDVVISRAPVEPAPARLSVETTAGRASLRSEGLPAVRADGRVVVTWAAMEGQDDVLVFLDTRTGRARRRLASPEHLVPSEDGESWGASIDRRALTRINRLLARGGYTSLPRLLLEGHERRAHVHPGDTVDEGELESETARFEGQGLRVVSRTDGYDDSAAITIADAASGRVLAEREGEGTPHAIHAADDRAFAVVSRSYCACECASWSELWPLRAPSVAAR